MLPPPSPPCIGHVSRWELPGLNTERWSPASASPGTEYGFHLLPIVTRCSWVTRQAAKTTRRRRALGISNQKFNHCRLPLSVCSLQVTMRQTVGIQTILPPPHPPDTPCASRERGPKALGVLELRVHRALSAVWASRQSTKDMWAPIAAPPPSADGTRAPWEMSRLSHSLGPAWQHPALSLTGGGQ